MNTNKILVRVIGFVVLLAIFLFAYFQLFSASKTNALKHENIYKLYQSYKKEFPDVQEVSPREAMELVNTGKVVFIDVRDAAEQSVSHLPGAIAMDRFLENLEAYSNYIKIGYATIGLRSGIVARELSQKEVPMYNLRGGLLAWVHAGGEVYTGETETRRIHVYSQEWDLAPDGYQTVW